MPADQPHAVGSPWPVEPPTSPWVFADPRTQPLDEDGEQDDLVAMGADLEPATILAAYRAGLFPMPLGGARFAGLRDPIGWWSPVRRGVLSLDSLTVSRSLRRSCRDFEIRIDSAFAEVVDGCADRRRPDGWIDKRIRVAYQRLHDLGWAHSVEAWRDGRLEGGLYGIALGGLFAGESMFHRARDASKVALVGLVELLADEYDADRLVDVQWQTPHLATLGVVEIDRADYVGRLAALADVPLPAAFRRPAV